MATESHCTRANKLSAAGGFLIGLSVLAYVSSFCLPAFVTNEPSKETVWGICPTVWGICPTVWGISVTLLDVIFGSIAC